MMKKHNGMRPQDIVVLLKIISIRDNKWRNIDIANAIGISPSEVSEALNRCKIAKLIDSKKRKVNINSFTEFLVYGLKYVFPTEPGAIVKGIPTAHSASPVKDILKKECQKLLENPNIIEGIETALPYGSGEESGDILSMLYFARDKFPQSIKHEKVDFMAFNVTSIHKKSQTGRLPEGIKNRKS
jgi:DNA-binding Lrp family transcriptional regulator